MSEKAPIPQGPESNNQSNADISAEEIVRRGIEVGALSPDTEVPDQDSEGKERPVVNTANKAANTRIGGPSQSHRTAEDMARGDEFVGPIKVKGAEAFEQEQDRDLEPEDEGGV